MNERFNWRRATSDGCGMARNCSAQITRHFAQPSRVFTYWLMFGLSSCTRPWAFVEIFPSSGHLSACSRMKTKRRVWVKVENFSSSSPAGFRLDTHVRMAAHTFSTESQSNWVPNVSPSFSSAHQAACLNRYGSCLHIFSTCLSRSETCSTFNFLFITFGPCCAASLTRPSSKWSQVFMQKRNGQVRWHSNGRRLQCQRRLLFDKSSVIQQIRFRAYYSWDPIRTPPVHWFSADHVAVFQPKECCTWVTWLLAT